MKKIGAEEINRRLVGIFSMRFGIELKGYSQIDLSKDLLGSDMGMKPRDLIYLYFDIEKEFGISIPQNAIADGRFNSFNNIANIISECIEVHLCENM